MFRKLFSSTLTLTFLATIALTGSACTGGGTSTADQPTQLVELGVSDEAVREILVATDLADAADVADFYIHTLDQNDADFGRINSECFHSPEDVVETTCGGCLCMADGMILCADFTCGEAIDHLNSPDAGMVVEPTIDDLVNPEEPEGDHTNTLTPAPIPDHGDDFDNIVNPEDNSDPLPFADLTPAPIPDAGMVVEPTIDDLVNPEEPEGDHTNTLTPAPIPDSTNSTPGLAEAVFAESPKSCKNGMDVGTEWEFETRRCKCMSNMKIACYNQPTETPEPYPLG